MIFAVCSCFQRFQTRRVRDWENYQVHITKNNRKVHRMVFQDHRAINFLLELQQVDTTHHASRQRRRIRRIALKAH